MIVQIDNNGFIVGDYRFVYNLYFLEHGSEFEAPSAAAVFKKIVTKWVEALQHMSEENGPIFLPFDPDDEWTDCLRVTPVGDRIVLEHVRLAVGGWGVFDCDLMHFINSSHEIEEVFSEIGEYSKDEIVTAFSNANVIEV